MENKKNDWFAALLYQPNYSLEQFNDIGITPENTGFRSRDEYKNIKAVQEAFTKDDKFDEKAFNTFYDSALLLYNDYANKLAENKIASSYVYDPWEWRKGPDANIADTHPVLGINPNPMRESAGIKGLGLQTETQYSIREIAQDQKYFDSETGEFAEQTPNDFAGVFKSFTAPTLVLATYDEDTEEIVNGKKIIHPKGSYKVNSYGAPYYETLGNREIYDKDVLHASDIFSIDGSKWNKFDFFDSDGLETDTWKVVAKNVARVIPFLIPGGVGTVFAGISAAEALVEFMPTFLKAVDGLVSNDVMGNDFGRKMNQYESWLSRLDYSVSDRSREKLVTFENIGKMFGDVSAQLFQQRAVAQIPRLFKNPKIANNQALGRALSYSYMSATSSQEAYSIFKQAGANDTTAGLATLALMGVYYKLMSSDYFKDVLFKGTWLDETQYKEKTWAILQDFQQAIAKGDVPIADNPQHAAATVKWFQNAFEKLIKGMPVTGKNFMQSSLSEGVEEVMEEVGIDTLKGITAGMNALGIPVAEDKLDFGFGIDDITKRYLTSFVGGAFGGAVFHGYNLMDPNYRASKRVAETPEARMSELIHLISQGKTNDVLKYAAKLHNQGLLGSNDLAGTKFETVEGINGLEPALVSSEKEMSQNDFVYNEFAKQIKYIETILSDEGFKKRRSEVAQLLNLDEETAIVATLGNGAGPFAMNASNLIIKDLNRLGTQIVQTRAKIDELVASLKPQGDTEYDKSEFEKALKDNEQYKGMLDELKRLRELRDEIYNKENISKYITQASVILSSDVMQNLRGFSDKNDFAILKYGKPYSEFTPTQQANIDVEYESYINGESDQPFEIGEIYRVLNEQLATLLQEKEDLYSKLKPDTSVESRTLGNDYIANIKDKINVKKQYDALVAKEDKTQEDIDNIAKLLETLTKLDEAIEIAKSNPAFSTSLFTNTPIEYSTLEEGANIILNHYRNFIGQLKTGDTELNDFYTDIRRKYQALDINQILTELTDTENIRDYEGMILPEYEGTFYDNSRDNKDRDEFIRIIKDLYSNIGINNTAALENYNQLLDLLKNKVGMSEQDIEQFLNNQVQYGIASIQNPDGTVNQIPVYESLLPVLNGKSLFDFISEIDGIRNQITYSDVSDLIKRFALNIGDPDLISILELIENEEKAIINSSKLDSYTVSNSAILEQLKKAKSFLEAIDAVISGAYNGLNHTINPYRKREKKPLFTELSENVAKTLHKNLEILKNRVKFILDLNDLNSSQKLKIQREIGVNMRVKFLSELCADVYIEDFKENFKKGGNPLDLREIIQSVVSSDFDFSNINEGNFNKYESQIISAETAIFNAIKNAGYTEEEIIQGLINVYGPKSIWKQRSTKLSPNKDITLTDYDLVLYAASIMSLNSNDFFVKYRNSIKELLESDISEEKKLVPVYGQEYALRLAYAFAHNKKLFNLLSDSIADTYDGNEDYVKEKRILHNIISVFGGAGTGKTRGVTFLLSRLLNDSEFRFIAPTKNQTDVLLDVFERSGKTEEALTFEEWFTKYAPGIDSIENVEYIKDSHGTEGGYLKTKSNTVNPIDWFSTDSSKTRIIVIDEAGLLNSIQLKAVSDYAEKFGILVITLGDFKQNSGTITYNVKGGRKTDADGFEDTVGIKTPVLSATFRAANIAKAHNYERLDGILSNIDEKVKNSDKALTTIDRNRFTKESPSIQLDYYIDDAEIFGDYITPDNDSFKSILDRVLDHGYNVLVITDSETEKKYVDPKYDGKVEFRNSTEAQGGEFDYVFVDKGIIDSEYAALQDLYTTSQRARLGSVILDLNSYYQNNLKITSVPNRSATLPYDMTSEQKQDFAGWRLSALESLTYSENSEQNLQIPENTTITPDSRKPKVEPEKPNDSKDEVTEDNGTPVEENEEKEETPTNNPEPVIPLVDETEKKEYILHPFEYEEETSTERLDNKIPEINSERGFTRVDTFYNTISSQEFFDSEVQREDSVLNYLADNGINLTKEQYIALMQFTHKVILNNNDFKVAVNSLVLPDLNNRKTEKVKSLLNNSKNNYVVWSINNGEQSLLSLRISDEVGKTLGFLPFGVTYGLPTGSFTAEHKFRRISKPYFKKGEFITIASLKKKYPWLNISYRGGIVINSDEIQQGNFSDRTKEYARINDGKTMAFGYDLASVDESHILDLDRTSDGTQWLHNQREDVDAFGVQRRINSKDIIGYSVSLYWLNGFGRSENKSSLINSLKTLGIISGSAVNDSDITSQVLNYLVNITGNNDWKNAIIQNRKFGKEYFDEVKRLNDSSELISYVQSNRILTDLIGNALREDSEVSILNLYNEFSRIAYVNKDNEKVRRNKVIHFDFNGDQYVIRVNEYDSEGRPTKIALYNYDPATGSSYGEGMFSEKLRVGTFETSIRNIVTKLMNRYNATLNELNSSNIRISIKEETWKNDALEGFYNTTAIASFYSVFGANIATDYDDILNPNKFKYAIYGNIKKGPVLPGTQLGQCEISDDFITDASEWFGSIYQYDENSFIPGQNGLDNDNSRILLDELNDRISSVRHTIKDKLPLDVWNQLKDNLIDNFKSGEMNDDQLDIVFNKFLSDINDYIKINSTSKSESEYSYVDGEIVESIINTKEYAYSNIVSDIIGNTSEPNHIIYSFGGIDVIQNGDRYIVMFTNPEGKLIGRETQTYQSWKIVNDVIDSEESQYGVKIPVAIKTYLNSLLTDTITDRIVDDYKMAIKYDASSMYITSVKRAVNSYLEDRLMKEEC